MTANTIRINSRHSDPSNVWTAEEILRSCVGKGRLNLNARHAMFVIGEANPGHTVRCETVYPRSKRTGRCTRVCWVSRNTGICTIENGYRSWREAILAEASSLPAV